MSLGPKQMEEAIFRNLPKNTGKTLDDWIKLIIKSGVKGIKEQIAWLKAQGLGTVQATFIVYRHNKVENIYEDEEKLVNDLFSGEFEIYRKFYDRIISKVKKFGSDVSIKPCKTYIPLYRKKQFVTIKPAKQGLIIGLAMKSAPKSKRIQPPANNIGSERIKYMVVIEKQNEIDDELMKIIGDAYKEN